MKLLAQYLRAATNLYGVIHEKELREIYNSQNSPALGKQQFKEETRACSGEALALIKNNYFISLAVDDAEIFESTVKIQRGKPRYIPDKEEFLRYQDMKYFEVNEAYTGLLKFLRTCSLFRKAQAEESAKEIQRCCRGLLTFHDTMAYYWAQRRFNIRNKRKAQEFLYLLDILRHNTRAREFNGHTAVELLGIVDGREIRRLIPR